MLVDLFVEIMSCVTNHTLSILYSRTVREQNLVLCFANLINYYLTNDRGFSHTYKTHRAKLHDLEEHE
jgi:hypothetical protein